MISIDEYDTPWEIAIALINAEVESVNPFTKRPNRAKAFDINDLKRIAEHLMNYAEVEEHETD